MPFSPLRAALCAVCLLGVGCSGGSSPTDSGSDGGTSSDAPVGTPVTIPFEARVGALPFACGQVFHGLGTTQTDWSPGDFRFYVSNVRLVNAAGHEAPVQLDEDGAWQHAGVALLDFEDKTGGCSGGTVETHMQIVGHVASDTYVGIHFTVGVPFDLDHQDVSVAASPLNVGGMFWSWEGGYKFVRIEGTTTGVPDGFNVHIGSTGCTADATGHVLAPCAAPNLIDVVLPAFDPTAQHIVADLAVLVAHSDLDVNTGGTPPGCMSASMDPECLPLFAQLGLAYDGQAAPASGQTFFRSQ